MKIWNYIQHSTMIVLAISSVFVLALNSSLMAQAVSGAQAEKQLSQPVKREGLTIQLISELAVIKAGEPFRVGLHIRHDKGYHTYWKQPGIVGIATSLEWTLPDGFTVSEISWPYPEVSDMAGHPCHGYERDVTLFVTITPPKSLPINELKIGVEVAWMCCAANCFPGFQDLTMTLLIGEKSEQHKQYFELIEKACKEVPAHSEQWQAKLLGKADSKQISLEIEAKDKSAKLDKVYLFSSDGQVSSDKKQVLRKRSDGKWTLTVERSKLSPKGAKSLPAILKVGSSHIRIAPVYQK